jgi:putative copper resistance protein D
VVTALGGFVVVALLALVAAAAYSAAFAEPGFADPGAVVRYGVGVSTLLTEAFIAVTAGALVLAVFVVPGGGRAKAIRPPRKSRIELSEAGGTPRTPERVTARRKVAPASATFRNTMLIAGCGAAGWTLAMLARLLFVGANMVGIPLSDPQFGEQWFVFVSRIPAGQVLLTILLIAAVVTTLCFLVTRPIGAMWTLALTASAFAFLASMGHASGGANHVQAVSGMFMHLAAAAVWIGALATIALLYLMPTTPASHLATITARYSAIAGWAFVLVAVSGFVSAVIRVGGFDGLNTQYGGLILAKTGLFVVLGIFGWLHRRHVVAQLGLSPKGARGMLPAAFWRLAGAEILLMGAVSGVAVALGGTAPPESDELPPDASPAYLLTGSELPPEPTFTRWFTEWNFDVLFGFLCIAGLVVYWRWVLRLRARGDSWSWLRTASWTLGMIIMFWVTSGGPAVYGAVLFSAHMLMHMLLAMVIPILLTLAAPVTLVMRAVPARKDDSRGGREWLLGIIHSRYGQFFSHPVVAAVNFAGSMILFYYTPAFEFAMETHLGHMAMIVHFTLAGYFFANALIGIDPGPNRPGYAQRLVLLLSTMVFHAFFGVTMMASETLLAADWFGLMGRPWGESAIADQQRGGAIAWGIGEIPTLSLAIIVAVSWATSDERAARRRDRQVEQYGDAELEEYNRQLAQLAQSDARQAERDN